MLRTLINSAVVIGIVAFVQFFAFQWDPFSQLVFGGVVLFVFLVGFLMGRYGVGWLMRVRGQAAGEEDKVEDGNTRGWVRVVVVNGIVVAVLVGLNALMIHGLRVLDILLYSGFLVVVYVSGFAMGRPAGLLGNVGVAPQKRST